MARVSDPDAREGREAKRLEALRRYDVLNTPPEASLDRLTQLAAALFDTPLSLISFVGEEVDWFKSRFGFDRRQVRRERSFCPDALATRGVTVVEDAAHDERFADHPLVTGAPGIRFYAGAPLVTPDGYRLGTFCVMDVEPRGFEEHGGARLEDLAATAMDLLEARRQAETSRRAEADQAQEKKLAEAPIGSLAGMSVDITERQAAKQALQESEDRFRTLVERASGIITVLDPEGTVRYESPSVERILGYAPADLEGGDPFARIHPDDRERVRATFASILQTPGSTERLHFRTRHADGSWVHLESLVRNLTDEPAVGGVAINSRDVTERKRTEAELRESERSFRTITETITQVFWVTTPEKDEIRYVSPAYEAVWGRSREALYENPRLWLDAVHPDDRARVRVQTQHAPGAYDVEYRIERPDGAVRWVRDRAFPVENGDGTVDHIVGTAQDVTERKRAEDELRESEVRHRALVERASDIMTIMEADGTVRYQSPSFVPVMGHSPEIIEGRSIFEGMHREDRERARKVFEKSLCEPDAVLSVQYRSRHADASWRHLESQVRNMLDDPAIEGIVANTRDVTDRVQVQAEREARRRAEDLLRAKTSFLNNMSHELRTPLASILGFADVLAEEIEGVHQEFAQRIAHSGTRLRDTLDAVLNLAQIESGTLEIDRLPVHVGEKVNEVVTRLQPLAQEHGLALTAQMSAPQTSTGHAYPGKALLDSQALHRILKNLIGNALKFTEEGRVTVTVKTDDDEVRVEVRDTGIGIDEDFLPHLFDDFRQESTGLKRTHEGSGLGLAITQRLVDMMGGRIDVESTPGEGSCFTVAFPRIAAAERDEAGASVPAPPREASSASLLVVEDNENTRALANHMLRARYDVTTAPGALTARERAAAGSFDGLLIDINLGNGQDGTALLRELRATPSCARAGAVAVTAHAMPGDEEQFLKAGFDAYLSKPFTKRELLEIVETTLALEKEAA